MASPMRDLKYRAIGVPVDASTLVQRAFGLPADECQPTNFSTKPDNRGGLEHGARRARHPKNVPICRPDRNALRGAISAATANTCSVKRGFD
jgi:hypothetical protein